MAEMTDMGDLVFGLFISAFLVFAVLLQGRWK